MTSAHPHLRVVSVVAEPPSVRVQGHAVVSFGPDVHREYTPEDAIRHGSALVEAGHEARRSRNHAPAIGCSRCGDPSPPIPQVQRVDARVVGVILACPSCGERTGADSGQVMVEARR